MITVLIRNRMSKQKIKTATCSYTSTHSFISI